MKALAEPLLETARARSVASGATEAVFGEVLYRSGKWDAERRVIVKAEVTRAPGKDPRDNPRFIVTNLHYTPKNAYQFYAKRGDAENRIKELKDGLRFDLTSCTSFCANQFRELLTMAAFALTQQLRYEARGTDCARAQVPTLRKRLIKVGAVISERVRRILFEAPRAYAWYPTWRLVAARVGAT